jgi:hypothetical protein
MKIYISGPISGRPYLNSAAFARAGMKLKLLGYDIVNPLDISYKVKQPATYLDYLKADIKELVNCDRIYMLDGWMFSRGARIERIIAWLLKIKRIRI